MVDDILIENGKLPVWPGCGPCAHGTFWKCDACEWIGRLQLECHSGRGCSLYISNTANTRVFNLTIPGAK